MLLLVRNVITPLASRLSCRNCSHILSDSTSSWIIALLCARRAWGSTSKASSSWCGEPLCHLSITASIAIALYKRSTGYWWVLIKLIKKHLIWLEHSALNIRNSLLSIHLPAPLQRPVPSSLTSSHIRMSGFLKHRSRCSWNCQVRFCSASTAHGSEICLGSLESKHHWRDGLCYQGKNRHLKVID